MVKRKYYVVSVMSGTSLDGIDLLYSEFSYDSTWSFNILKSETYSYSKDWKEKLKTLTDFSLIELKKIDYNYSEYLAYQIQKFIDVNKIETIDFIASHGHTALHKPEENYTYQIGNQQILADVLNRKVICDFRVQDVELGGQGAPLVPIGDKLLFNNYDYCINLGGFANISFEQNDNRIAFDICPVNVILNFYVNKLGLDYDDKGEISKSGIINNTLLEKLNNLNFYNLKPPKSLGIEWVLENVFPLTETAKLEIKDVLSTVIEHVAFQISKYLKEKNKVALITGGGAYNLFLIERIKALSNSEISIPNSEIIEFKEALIFGFLGVLKNENKINCLKSVTGASKNHSSGKILYPKK